MMKKAMVAAAGLVMVFGAVLVGANAATETKAAPADVQRAVFRVDNLSCGACLSRINSALAPEAGFSGMGANLLRKMVAVDFAAPLSPEKIGSIVTELGYPATLDRVEALTEKQTFAYLRSMQKRRGYGTGCCTGAQAPSTAPCPGTASGCAIAPDSPETQTDI